MTGTTTAHEHDADEPSVDQAELACMRGHSEATDRLRDLGWTDEQIDELLQAVNGYEDFARCVADEVRWHRD